MASVRSSGGPRARPADARRRGIARPSYAAGAAWLLGIAGLGAAAGCGDLFHATAWSTQCELEPDAPDCTASPSSATGAATGSGGDGGVGGAAPTTTTSGGGGVGGAGGEGGGPGFCGDGVIDAGEECDDGNQVAGDGCTGCVVDCSGVGEAKRAGTHHCYLHVVEPKLAWADARAACSAWGGDLVSVTSAGEQTFLETFLVERTWTGGNDLALEGTFVWSNGDPMVYDNWYPGEPNDSGGEDCLELADFFAFAWNDVDCVRLQAYVCERSPLGS